MTKGLQSFVVLGREGVVFDEVELDLEPPLDLGEELRFLLRQQPGQGGPNAQADSLTRGVEAGRGEESPAQVQGDREVRLDAAGAAAAGAGAGQDLLQVAAGALSGDLDQAELRDLEEARAGAVFGQLLFELFDHLAAVLRVFHVDEVHDEDAAQVTQADLPRDLGDRLKVRREDRLFERVAADELSRVDVDRDEGLRLVDDNRPAGGEVHPGLQSTLDLSFDAKTLEEGSGAFVELDARREIRSDR